MNHKRRLSRKAVSPIIASILLIALVVASATVIWYVTINFLQNSDVNGEETGVIVTITEVRGQIDRDGDGLIDTLNLTVIASDDVVLTGVVLSQDQVAKENWVIQGGTLSLLKSQTTYLDVYVSGNLYSLNADELTGSKNAIISLYSDTTKIGEASIYVQGKAPQASIAIYNDTSYPTSWISSANAKQLAQYIYENLTNAGITVSFVSGDDLPTFMSENPKGWIINTQGVIPITVFNNTNLDNSMIEQWFDNGGNIIWTADWPFYYFGSKGGSLTRVGNAGERYFFDVSQNMVTTRGEVESPTAYGQNVIGDFSFQSNRPFLLSQVESNGYSYLLYGTKQTTGDPIRIFKPGTGQGHFVEVLMKPYTTSDIGLGANLISSIMIDISRNGLFPAATFTVTNVASLSFTNTTLDSILIEGYQGDLNLPVSAVTIKDDQNQVMQVNYTISGGFTQKNLGRIYLHVNNDSRFYPGNNFSISLTLSVSSTYSINTDPYGFTVPPITYVRNAVYYDPSETSSWITSDGRDELYHNLTAILDNYSIPYIVVDKYMLQYLMTDKVNITIALTVDILPSTVYKGEQDSLVEQWVRTGGTLIYPGDVPFYYYSDNGQRLTVGYNGMRYFLNLNGGLYDTTTSTVTITSVAKELTPSLSNHTSSRKLKQSSLDAGNYNYYILSQTGTSLGDVEITVGAGRFLTLFQIRLSANDMKTNLVGQVIAEYMKNRTTWFIKGPVFNFTSIEGYDTSFNGNIDFLKITMNATLYGKVTFAEAYVNSVPWTIDGINMIDGLSSFVLASQDNGASTLTTGTINVTIGVQSYNQSTMLYYTQFITVNTITPLKLVVYYDERYPNAWNGAPLELYTQLTAALTNNSFTFLTLGADTLYRFTLNSVNGTLIPIHDVLPDTIWNGNDNSRIEQWLENGGNIFWLMDWFAYYIGHADGTRTTVGSNGARRILDYSIVSTQTVDVTALNPFNGTWSARRPVDTNALNNNGFTYTRYDSTSNSRYSDILIFNAGFFTNGTQAQGKVISMYHLYLTSSNVPLLVSNIIAALNLLYP